MPVINTKDVGVCTFAYPNLKALALPTCKDKQRSQPTPGYMYTTHNAFLLPHITCVASAMLRIYTLVDASVAIFLQIQICEI